MNRAQLETTISQQLAAVSPDDWAPEIRVVVRRSIVGYTSRRQATGWMTAAAFQETGPDWIVDKILEQVRSDEEAGFETDSAAAWDVIVDPFSGVEREE